MPNWDGIEDGSESPERVWFSRVKDTDPWKPLRKCDCRTLNANPGGKVQIEGCRATANLADNTIKYNFYNSPSRQLISAIWFFKIKKGDKECGLEPLSLIDEKNVEELYLRAVKESSSLGEGLRTIIKEDINLENDELHKVMIVKTGSSLSLKRRSKNNFSLESPTDLQRGYGEYTVEGEKEEIALGPVRHLMFVIHGIGEALWSRDDFTSTPGMIDEINTARINIHKKQYSLWKKECDKKEKKGEEKPAPPGRIEFIPIEWYERIHSASSTLKRTLISTTLRTIPKLRVIANDVVFDVLMYLTPEFTEKVLECVTNQICDLYSRFQIIHENFAANRGLCSIIGHSLGSVISWDILAILKNNKADRMKVTGTGTKKEPLEISEGKKNFSLPTADSSSPLGYQAYASEDNSAGTPMEGTWGPSLPTKMTKTIPFDPAYTFFLGSPIGLFLTLRGAQTIFDEMRLQEEGEAAVGQKTECPSSPFTLPSGRIFNIFHPSDPIAYRIEPLLVPPDTHDSELPSPAFLVADGRGVRFHVKAKEFGDNLVKTFSELFKKPIDQIPDDIETLAPESDSLEGVEKPEKPRKKARVKRKYKSDHNFALGGKSNRVDYQLQPGVVENEYLSAISAHSSYFVNDDFLDFLVQCADEE